jgi:transcriptional regulator with XRE-family HTH domain
MYDEASEFQSEILTDAWYQAGKTQDHVAAVCGVSRSAIAEWIRGAKRVPLSAIGTLTEALGPEFLARVLRPHGYTVVRLRSGEEAEIWETIQDAALRLGKATGLVAGGVADATDPDGPGGADITREEAAEIRGQIDHLHGYLDLIETQLAQATEQN